MRKYIIIGLCSLATACTTSPEENGVSKSYYQRYFQLQIDTLLAEKYAVLRHTSEGEEVKQERLDSMSADRWNQELRGFVNATYVDIKDTSAYDYAIDQSGKFEIRRFTAKDTLAALQRWEEMKVDGVTQLITWETQKRSVLMDRRVEMTYQPMKGYRVRMQEDAAWAAPRDYEIFAEFVK
jgi:hydroxymethylpyrimidine pyrophosphatase-like HAD family hydrolase